LDFWFENKLSGNPPTQSNIVPFSLSACNLFCFALFGANSIPKTGFVKLLPRGDKKVQKGGKQTASFQFIQVKSNTKL
jgi:hypothetical protein